MKRAVSGEISTRNDAVNILKQLSEQKKDGCLEVSFNSVTWYLYFEQGQLIYATYSIEPIDLLDNHLRKLSRDVQGITSDIRTQVRINFAAETASETKLRPDYQAISWLVLTKNLSASDAATLISTVAVEVLESYLRLNKARYTLKPKTSELPIYCRLDLSAVLTKANERNQAWQALSPAITSPYQCPKLAPQSGAHQKYAAAQIQKLQKILRGFSFRHLGVLLNLDELKLAQNLHPLIQDKVVVLSDPAAPFNQLPKFDGQATNPAAVRQPQPNSQLNNLEKISVAQKQHTIACIDDSPSILNTINRYLQGQDVSVVMIDDPVKALVQIIRAKPDLILLDVGMPWVDGYELCRLIRKNSRFKNTPVVMVTGNTGLIDRAKAKVSGATDYMTKPFTQPDLLNMVFRHLT
ncbi:DNA-binding response regulator MtrA [Acaryochloris thomasi RCC1774]|uniref:DNA-binding response regulator MtrA n=1 Tax=Acaryochloris thomasi RCC1774 TaxID=1764569 RepID=A0A2W1JS95_9CYAN|nr:response regulator [Acaryochloris thomasi]PZD71891.1 DNA-binding response regulator MtrA [Acaryochloris thomasi RCC1774]